MTDAVTIYHNPRCSKSRETLSLLQSRSLLVLGSRLVVSRLVLVESGGAHGVLGKELLVAGQIGFG